MGRSRQRKENIVYNMLNAQAWKLWNEGKALYLLDESIKGDFSEEEAVRCIQVGLLCTQYAPRHRPTMPCVLKMLLGEDPSLQEKTAEAASRRPNIESDGVFYLEKASPEIESSHYVSVSNQDSVSTMTVQ